MKKKDIIKLFSIIIVITLMSNSIAFAVDNDSIESEINGNNEKIEALEDKKNEINQEISEQEEILTNLQDEINSKSKAINSINEEVDKYKLQVSSLEDEIWNINSEIDSLEAARIEKETAVAELEVAEKETEEKISYRIRTYAKVNFTYQYIYMLVSSKSLSEAVQALAKITKIVEADRKLIAEGKEKRKEINKEKEKIAANLQKQEEMAKEIKDKQKELEVALNELEMVQANHEVQLAELNELESEKNETLASLEGESNDVEAQIEQLTMFNAELQAQLDQLFEQTQNQTPAEPDYTEDVEEDNTNDAEEGEDNNSGDSEQGSSVNNSGYIWPTQGVITEPYGPRVNPVTGNPGFHHGIDIGAPFGTPIYASAGGTVAYAGYWGDYGNIVIINHPEGSQTFYAHCQSIYVSVGEQVSQGQTIGEVGSTGMSTGPHLHFELRINGSSVNPLSYIS